MEDASINFLLQQAPVITVMGAVIYWLVRYLQKVQDKQDLIIKSKEDIILDKDNKLSSLSTELVKLSTLFQETVVKKDSEFKEQNELILEKLEEIKNSIYEIK